MTAESVSRIAARAKAPPSTQALSDAICFNAAREQVLGREAANCYRKLEELRHRKIEEAAYFMAQQRDFAPGYELDDWIEAERDIDEASRPLPSY